ncbi:MULTISPECIES: ABC transporter ATP-binding protein [Mammaliicoccus]|uniref:Sodium ABC transporter ATP-binding protein n=1 Tax=Mammaliicoccus vitulinus TaxID=71237 RepID=A0A2T4PX36_9STAP|nr:MULTISPECIES: ABC transporter ATP-binding protein [Mammaliicoccus]HAL10256.1 sodium ABC transporter ATP-binding protein [Staphylococcus sp.]MBM6629344.1 ABC transporter ATP-binding protein [Mammaliicoccus vitulinus]MBO3077599.1 ABC transporter ATP-binding protein [Mammaliicoccus vitulinus]MEB7658367.1 ABC transporter ATP-binding protein [Mammaliicoccus vitulinus]PTI31100.1 sodium ABC transporter ATP-binding protein [Mammaliicoccus vitulinus]
MTLIIKNVSKKFNDFTAVHDVNLEVPKGTMYGFLGGNGAGKTTTFRMILGLLPKTTGVVTFNDEPIDYSMTNKIGYLPEERGLHPKLKVWEQVQYLAELKGMKRKDIATELDYWLKRFDAFENKEKKIEALSKGNQQKVQLIAAIIHKPELLILDEPFSGLDPVNVELLKLAVKDLKEQGTTIIFSSHRMEHVEELCDYICIMSKGKAIVSGSLDNVKDDFGKKDIFIEGEHDFEFLKDFEGVEDFKMTKKGVKFTISDESYAENIYQNVTKLGYLKRFQVAEPSLNDIFIAKVGEKHE